MMRFGIVGSGWRVRSFLRAAKASQGRIQVAGIAARTPQKATDLAVEFDIPVYRSVTDLAVAQKPDFMVTSVSWNANPEIIRETVGMNLPVLSETPPATTVEEMQQMWSLVEQGALIQVAEQYWLQPLHAARLAFANSGCIGRISQAQVSVAHGYHGISLMRRFLNISAELPTISAHRFVAPIVQGPNRQGPPIEKRVLNAEQTFIFFDFGDRLGMIDFTGEQYFSWIRGQRLLVRGECGEIVDDRATYLADYRTPIHVNFIRHSAGPNGNLEGNYLKGIQAGEKWWYRNPTAPAELSDDEIAVADLLLRMTTYVEGGVEVYSLAEACQDRYLDILSEQAAQQGQIIHAEAQSWTKALTSEKGEAMAILEL